MGNKKSTPKSNDLNKNEPVKRRTKHGPKHERPLSDPGILIGDNPMSPLESGFYLKPNNSRRDDTINGKGVTGITTSPVLLPVTDYDEPSGSQAPSGAQVEIYRQALEHVLRIWPEYYPVKEISVHETSAGVVNTLEQIANRLCQQHTSIKKLSEECHELKQILDELQEERDSIKQMLRKRETEVNGLKEDVGLLLGELRRRGHDVKLPNRVSTSNAYDNYSESDLLTPRSDNNSIERDDLSTSLNRGKRNKDGIYAATPLILAEGDRSRSLLAKKLSIREVTNDPNGFINDSDRWQWPDSNASDDLKEQVKWLQAALEKERDRNKLLSSPRSPKELEYSQLTIDQLSQRYTTIQHEAFDKVRRQVINNLGHVEEMRQWGFISSLMQDSFNVARDTLENFQDIFISLIMDPTNPRESVKRNSTLESHKPKRTGSILDNVRKFEERRDLVRKRMKKGTSIDVPDDLSDQVILFLAENSDIVDVSALVENTIDSLRKQYSDCLTPGLLNQSNFTNFIHHTCRLSWQLNLHNPSLYVSSEMKKFESRYHVTNKEVSSPGEDIAYYMWPILLSKRHGDVLCKGIVQL